MKENRDDYSGISTLLGKTLSKATRDNDGVHFQTTDGAEFVLRGESDCCNDVTLEDVSGSLESLIGSPITLAEAVGSEGPSKPDRAQGSETWTLYRLATLHGNAECRFYGTSNGYYSETAELVCLTEGSK